MTLRNIFSAIATAALLIEPAIGFVTLSSLGCQYPTIRGLQKAQARIQIGEDESNNNDRRNFLQTIISTGAIIGMPRDSFAADIEAPVEMKNFIDPKGLFAITVPNRFFAIRRTVKGDLPNEATGKGRRGSSIFTAGDMAKAEVIAVERFPTAKLLEEEGIAATGDLTTFPNLGNPQFIANLIVLRRDRDKPGQTKTTLLPDTVSVSEDGKTLNFQLQTEIDVQKPELLLEQTGVSELVRITLCKTTLTSNDGQMMGVFASGLKQDLEGTADGKAMRESVESFVALDQSQKSD